MARCAIDYMFAMLPRYDDSTNVLTGLGYILYYPGDIPIKLRNYLVRGTVAFELDNNQIVILVSAKQVDFTC